MKKSKSKPPPRGPVDKTTEIYKASAEMMDDALRRALERSNGNITHARQVLGASRTQMTRLVKEHDLQEFAKKLRAAVPGAASNGKGRQPGT